MRKTRGRSKSNPKMKKEIRFRMVFYLVDLFPTTIYALLVIKIGSLEAKKK